MTYTSANVISAIALVISIINLVVIIHLLPPPVWMEKLMLAIGDSILTFWRKVRP
jgi:hypothetical protein